MNILVIGANGRVGRKLVTILSLRGHKVFAGSRQGQGDFSTSVSHVILDLLSSPSELAEKMKGMDAVYFVSGSRGKQLLQVDLHGAVKTMQAAELSGVRRYIMLSSVFALSPERWKESFLNELTDYNIAKHYADLYLTKISSLDYTILQPGALTENEGTGMISVNIEAAGSNSIDNVVETLTEILSVEGTIGKVITMHDGSIPIQEALRSL